MKLYCMRHCEALSSQEDPERALSAHGRQDADTMANFLKSKQAIIGHVLHSSKLRTKQTADIIALALPIEKITECDTLLSENMDVMPLVDMIQTWDSDTLLVGHMPFIPRLIATLCQIDAHVVIEQFSTGTLACLVQSDEGSWQLNWVQSPEDLQQV